MYKNYKPEKNQVLFQSRQEKVVTCPYCWTDQRTERNFCYHCGAGFTYRDDSKPSSSLVLESVSPARESL